VVFAVAEQPYALVAVTVYSVVVVGEATGLLIFESVNDDDGDHEYVALGVPVKVTSSM
jgi:hypothetical protein